MIKEILNRIFSQWIWEISLERTRILSNNFVGSITMDERTAKPIRREKHFDHNSCPNERFLRESYVLSFFFRVFIQNNNILSEGIHSRWSSFTSNEFEKIDEFILDEYTHTKIYFVSPNSVWTNSTAVVTTYSYCMYSSNIKLLFSIKIRDDSTFCWILMEIRWFYLTYWSETSSETWKTFEPWKIRKTRL